MNQIILDEIKVSGNRVDYFFSPCEKLQKYFKKSNHLFLEYNHNIEEVDKSILTIPFVANVIPLTWITNSKLIVTEIDFTFFNCIEKIKMAYRNMFPNVEFRGEFFSGNTTLNSYVPDKEAAQLFSGGLDALATYIRNKEKSPMLITEYGWHNENVAESRVWEEDKKNVLRFAEDHGLDNILIHSNYGTFLNANKIDRDYSRKLGDSWWHGLHHSLAIISAAIPIAVKLKIECIYIASSYFEGYKAKCASDPTIDNEIKYASGRVFHDGYDINRQEKVKLMVDYYSTSMTEANLRVCFLEEENCCNCEKCMRTIIGIIAEGEDPNNFGFKCPEDLSFHTKQFLQENVKYFTPARIMQWNLSKNRMKENVKKIKQDELLKWFLEYDFALERKKSLIVYRITKFFPIVERRFKQKINQILTQNS